MKKLIVSIGAEFVTEQHWLRFDSRTNDISEDRWICLRMNKSKENAPYQCYEIKERKEDLIQLINFLQNHLDELTDNK